MVLDKIRTDGLMPTLEAVRNKLDQPLAARLLQRRPRGSRSAPASPALRVGDRVVSNGKHAEVVSVPVNLCARIPDGVTTTRRPSPCWARSRCRAFAWCSRRSARRSSSPGSGLIGLVTVQLLRAHGCRVLGIDFDPGEARAGAAIRRRGGRSGGRRGSRRRGAGVSRGGAASTR